MNKSPSMASVSPTPKNNKRQNVEKIRHIPNFTVNNDIDDNEHCDSPYTNNFKASNGGYKGESATSSPWQYKKDNRKP